MALEIEKKYLLKSADIVKILSDEGLNFEKKSITQIYTRIDKNSEVRLRKINSSYVMTTKEGQGLKRNEREEVISEKLFKLAKKSAIGDYIKKTRYLFKLQNLPTCIDIYDDKFKNLAILEIEFPDEMMANSYQLLPMFKNEIIKDVTLDEAYKNKNLALFGRVDFKSGISLQSIFQSLKKEPFKYKFLLDLPSAICAYDGIRTIYYSLYEKILFYQNTFLKTNDVEALHQFRVNIRKTRSLLQSMQGVFDATINSRFIKDLKLIASSTNQKRDMDVFMEYLDTLDEIEAEEILEALKDQGDFHTDKVCEMLNSEEYARVMQEWGVVIRDEDGFFKGEMGNYPLKKIGAISLIKRLKRMKKRLNILYESTELYHFHSVRIEFKRLRYLSEFFSILFKDKSIENTMIVSKKMQSLFGTLQDRDVANEILLNLENSDKFASNIEIMHAKEVLHEIINDDIYSLKYEILKGKKSLFKVINSSIKDLEKYC